MVGSGGGGDSRSCKEAVGMMALHEALRNVCLTSDWTYSVFWTIRPRPRCRGGNGCKIGDDNGSLMLMWEDGFCRSRMEEMDGAGAGAGAAGEAMAMAMAMDPLRKAFSKMSIQLYNYGEGLMGKVASDKCHKWVFKEPPSESCEPNIISNYWQSSFDALPPEWTEQFASGVQTIAVIQAGHGLLQLGSCKIIAEDLHFVLRMRHMFESLGYQSGFFLSQLFSSTRTSSPSSSSTPMKLQTPTRPPPSQLYNWNHAVPLPSNLFHPSPHQIGLMPNKDSNTHHFLLPPHHHDATPTDEIIPEHHHHHQHDSDLKWPNGLSLFTALTGRSDDAKLLFGHEGLQANNKSQVENMMHSGSQMNLCSNAEEGSKEVDNVSGTNTEDYLGLESHSSKVRKMESSNRFKRSFTMPARMATSSSSSTSLDQHHAAMSQGMEYRSSEAGIYSDIMETFLE